MGNRLGRKRDSIDDRYTRPQGLYQHRDIDHKKLRKLILDSKLAPCYPGDEDCLAPDLEECPICFLYYPSLNRSRCCMKGICTECFLQMKPPHTTRPTQCPFCKTSNYAVEYRGVRTNEEKGKEQIEEQKVIEAKIRMQQQEQSEEEERLQKKQAMNSLNQMMMTGEEVEFRDMAINSVSASSFRSAVESDDIASSSTSHACLASKQPLNSRHSREEEFDLDLEELMVMEAIWLSIQDRGNDGLPNRNISSEAASSSGENYTVSTVIPAESSSTGGLVCAAAALAEHQHFNDNSITLPGASSFPCDTVPRTSHFSTGESVAGHYTPERWADASSDVRGALQLSETEWTTEPSTGYVGSDDDNARRTDLQVPGGMNITNGHLIPETFEEQMMLAMAVSLAEARSRTNTQGVTWM